MAKDKGTPKYIIIVTDEHQNWYEVSDWCWTEKELVAIIKSLLDDGVKLERIKAHFVGGPRDFNAELNFKVSIA